MRSAIDGRVVNAGAKLYRKFNNKHLEPLAGKVVGEDTLHSLVRTCQSNIHVAQAAQTRAFKDGPLLEAWRRIIEEPGYIGQELSGKDVPLGELAADDKVLIKPGEKIPADGVLVEGESSVHVNTRTG